VARHISNIDQVAIR